LVKGKDVRGSIEQIYYLCVEQINYLCEYIIGTFDNLNNNKVPLLRPYEKNEKRSFRSAILLNDR